MGSQCDLLDCLTWILIGFGVGAAIGIGGRWATKQLGSTSWRRKALPRGRKPPPTNEELPVIDADYEMLSD